MGDPFDYDFDRIAIIVSLLQLNGEQHIQGILLRNKWLSLDGNHKVKLVVICIWNELGLLNDLVIECLYYRLHIKHL